MIEISLMFFSTKNRHGLFSSLMNRRSRGVECLTPLLNITPHGVLKECLNIKTDWTFEPADNSAYKGLASVSI